MTSPDVMFKNPDMRLLANGPAQLARGSECVRPNFLVIGAAKCATSTLCRLLSEHPHVYIPPIKELYFFSDDELFHRKGWSWYESQFFEGRNLPFRGEGTPLYTMRDRFPQVAFRIAEALPDVKLIYMVRHPLRQIESWWIQERANGNAHIPPDFNQAIRERFDWMVRPANYFHQLEAYQSRFDRDQILVQFYEDFCADPSGVVHRCLEFIGADVRLAPDNSTMHVNSSEGKRVLDPRFDTFRVNRIVRLLKWLVPAKVKFHMIRHLFMRVSWQGRPHWEDSTRAMVVAAIGESTRRFLSEHDRPDHFWDLNR
jgi:hypothetical protein